MTDKILEDIKDAFSISGTIEQMKNKIKQYNYEVEEEKSYLEHAREYKENNRSLDIDIISELYEKAIEEEQKKHPKIDDDLIEWLKSWDGWIFEETTIDEDTLNIKRLLKQLGVK